MNVTYWEFFFTSPILILPLFFSSKSNPSVFRWQHIQLKAYFTQFPFQWGRTINLNAGQWYASRSIMQVLYGGCLKKADSGAQYILFFLAFPTFLLPAPWNVDLITDSRNHPGPWSKLENGNQGYRWWNKNVRRTRVLDDFMGPSE